MRELTADDVVRRVDPRAFSFNATDEIPDVAAIVGQDRAVEAFNLGVEIRGDGFNIFALGSSGLGKRALVRRFLDRRAAERPTPHDWCYVNNFDDPQKPRALRMPAGRGRRLRTELENLTGELSTVLAGAFESEEYQNRREVIVAEFKQQEKEALEAVHGAAREQGIGMMRTPAGIVFAPVKDEEFLAPDAFNELPQEERDAIQAQIEELQGELQKVARQAPRQRRERRLRVRDLNHEVAQFAIAPLFDELQEHYEGLDDVLEHLGRVREDIAERARDFFSSEKADSDALPALMSEADSGEWTSRYQVNLFVDHGATRGAPVVFESNPNFQSLVGRVESHAMMGTVVTDFTMIKPGALHKANGGYLLLDARQVLQQPAAWDTLKRALLTREVTIEAIAQSLGMINTVSLEPECIPLSVKVVLIGDRELYYMLARMDEDFAVLFKVAADFEDTLDWTNGDSTETYARYVGRLVKRDRLRPFDRGAVAAVMENSARLAGDREKLSLHTRDLRDLMREADYWAGQDARDRVVLGDVKRALEVRERRLSRARDRIQEQIQRGVVLLDVDGETVGQVNALSVLSTGVFAFGRPTRITARARVGRGQVVDIEREVDLSGPIHSKGVLILAGFLGQRYAVDRPLALAASLVFEQSYGGIDGDSASLAELCALLSAISQVPIRQSLAVTGSINQHGEVQPIGGGNEKIEGFFDVCTAQGLTGRQGVLIPEANAKHLMLRDDVVEAVREGRFRVWTVSTVDEGLSLLTGRDAGSPNDDGSFPEGSVNDLVRRRLIDFSEKAKAFARKGNSEPRRATAKETP